MQLHFISESNTVASALLRSVLSLFLKIQDRRDSTEPSKSRRKLSLKGTHQKGNSKQQGHHFVRATFQEVLASEEKYLLVVMSKNKIVPFKFYVSSFGGSHILCVLEKRNKTNSQAATYITCLFIYSVNSKIPLNTTPPSCIHCLSFLNASRATAGRCHSLAHSPMIPPTSYQMESWSASASFHPKLLLR